MIIIALVIVILVVVYELCKLKRLVKQEGFAGTTTSPINTEALANLASMYTNGTLKVTNLEVIGNSKLGQWDIRGDRIGIPGIADMHLASDKWMRLTTPNGDANTFAGSGDIGGFAGLNIHAHNNITAKNTTNAGHLKVTRGSDFTALTAAQGGGENHGLGNHFFQDWNSGGKRLRVGNPFGTPGIYAEDRTNIIIGHIGGTQVVTGQNNKYALTTGDDTFGIQSVIAPDGTGGGFLLDHRDRTARFSPCNPEIEPGRCTWERMKFVKVSVAQ